MKVIFTKFRTAVGILLFSVQTFSDHSIVFSQAPSRDKFNFILENNFENNQPGPYIHSEYIADWDLGSSITLAPHEKIDIISESDTRNHQSMRAYFPKGTVGPSEHGAYWETPITGCTEIYFSYDVRFKPGFDWVIGGKIPGLCGGKTAPGKIPGPTDGFSARVMWKENGKPVAYVYHQNQTTLYGNSYYWGNFAFTTGKWYNVTIRVVLNTVGSANGIYEGYINGKLMFQKKDFEYRGVESVKIEKMNISMFFGGSSAEWAPTRDEWIDTDNFVAYTYSSKATNVPRGLQACAPGWTLLHPYYDFSGNTTEFLNSPTDLISPAHINNRIDLSWKDNSTNEKGFKLFRSLNKTTGFSEISDCGVNETSCTDESVENGTAYYYKVCAYNDQGNSDFTPVLEVSSESTASTNNPPSISDQQFTVSESGFNNIIGTIESSDKDLGQQLKYSIISGNSENIFNLDEKTGKLTASQEIFGPGIYSYKLVVQVSDNATIPQKASATVTIMAKGNSKVVHIDPKNTNDLYANGSVNHPYDSWSDIVWNEGFSYLQKRGTSAAINILQIGASNVRIGAYGEGIKPEIKSTSSTFMISGFDKSFIYISDLILQANDAASCLYFLGAESDSIVIENCSLTANENAIKVMDANTVIARYNTIRSAQEGIFSTARKNEIYYNIFEECKAAVNIMSKSSSTEILNNVFVDNVSSVEVPYGDLTMFNNIFYLSGTQQVALTHGSGRITSDNNIFYPIHTRFFSVAGKSYSNLNDIRNELKIDKNSLNADPEFVDMFTKNYHLGEGSPAINSGKNIIKGHDFEGNKVPIFSLTDIGAFEFNGNRYLPGQASGNPEASIKIFPNPSKGPCTIEVKIDKSWLKEESLVKTQELVVIDLAGKIILTKLLNFSSEVHTEKIDLSELPNGLYFVVLKTANYSTKEKLLINR